MVFALRKRKKILDHATDYYRKLFGPSTKPHLSMDPSCWDSLENISLEDNERLVKHFSEEEVKNTVMTMEINTAPGPDCLSIEFYQVCWEIVKNDIMKMFEDFIKNKLDIERLNYGTITLLPKIKEANQIQQYRPICLLNVIYKIFTKTLMLRLEGCMNKIINKAQNAFIKGRNIMDGIMSLHEILHDTRANKDEPELTL